MRFVCMWFFPKINYRKINTRYGVNGDYTSHASVVAASGASCRGCQVTQLDLAAITADDDRILPRGPPCRRRWSIL